MRLFLSNIIHPTLWILIDTLAEFRSENDGLIKTDKQKAKILKLLNRQKPTLHKYQASPIIVHNLSNKALDQATERALAKGFNFAITPSQIPIENIICEIEKAPLPTLSLIQPKHYVKKLLLFFVKQSLRRKI